MALAWLTRGDMNIGVAWMSRARRLLDGAPESTAHGYLAYLAAIHAVLQRDLDDLPVRVRELQEICSRLDDSALTALALVAHPVCSGGCERVRVGAPRRLAASVRKESRIRLSGHTVDLIGAAWEH